MAALPIIWYSVLTGATLFSVVYRFVKTIDYIPTLETFILIGGLIYCGYMLMVSLTNSGKNCFAGCVNAENSGFVQVHLSKYVTALAIGCLFLAFLFNLIWEHTKFSGKGFLFYLDFFITNIGFPICMIVELFITPRQRSPKIIQDLLCILLFIVIFTVYELLCYWFWVGESFTGYFKTKWKVLIFRVIFSLLGYFVYDIILFKKNGEQGSYSLINSSSTSS